MTANSSPEETPDDNYVEAAKRLFHKEGEIEVDDSATVSRGDPDGAYVQAWVWVPESEAKKA